MKLLIVEDDDETRQFIARGLQELGHSVEVAADGVLGLRLAQQNDYDVIVLDRMLPLLDGMNVLRQLRSDGRQTPILMLTALGEVDARVEGFEAGADDYLAKPFAFAELVARVAALSRRHPLREDASTRLVLADLELDLLRRKARRAGRTLDLQPREFKLLAYLMKNAGRVVTRTMLLEQVWNYHFDPQTSLVETHISRLRAKIDRDFDVPLLQTVRGTGYCLCIDGEWS